MACMKSEYESLSGKIDKLEKFFETDDYKVLSEQKQNLICAQYGAMVSYRHTLMERIRVESL